MLCKPQYQSMDRLLAICFCISLLSVFALADPGLIGVNYGRIANDLPSPTEVVKLLKSQGVGRVKLYDTDSTVLKALAGTNIKVTVALPNELLFSVSRRLSAAYAWVQQNISSHYPSTQIEAIAVGNEVFVDPKNTTNFLVPAMKNVQAALVYFKLDSFIKISSPIALTALQSSYPASSGSFRTDLIEPVIKPMLDFLRETKSYLMVNAYPFFAYAANSDVIPLDYALFRENPGVIDSGNGLHYSNLFEAQIDAVYAALNSLKYSDLKMVVTETGWPSKGDEKEIGASEENASAYNGNLVKRVLNGGGTPLRPNENLDVYLFALFNENKKPGPISERNYGLFYPNEEKVYQIPLTIEEVKGWKSTPVNSGKTHSPAQTQTSPVKGVGNGSPAARGNKSWCVANEKVGKEKLQKGLDYACGETDCRQIQPGATCYDPDTLGAHASFAFNAYYQKKGRASGSCDFGGAAYVVSELPKIGKCELEATDGVNGNGNEKEDSTKTGHILVQKDNNTQKDEVDVNFSSRLLVLPSYSSWFCWVMLVLVYLSF